MAKATPAQNDATRLQTILDLLNISAFKLAKLVGITPASLYHILGGTNQISDNLAEKIIRRFDNISYAYLKGGTGDPILKTATERRNQHNLFLLPGEKLDEVERSETETDLMKNDLYRQIQELIYQSKKSNDLMEKLIQENKEIKELLSNKI